MDNKIHEMKEKETFWGEKMYWNNNSGPSIGFPLLLIVIGIYWLGSEMNLWPIPFSIWPVLFIVFGSYWLIKNVFFRK